jgi:hypothetical protein
VWTTRRRNPSAFACFDGLVPGNDPAAAVEHDRATRAVLAQRLVERVAAAVGAAVRVVGVAHEVGERLRHDEIRAGVSADADGEEREAILSTWRRHDSS